MESKFIDLRDVVNPADYLKAGSTLIFTKKTQTKAANSNLTENLPSGPESEIKSEESVHQRST